MSDFLGNLPHVVKKDVVIALGIEGSANKVGVGIVKYTEATGYYHHLTHTS